MVLPLHVVQPVELPREAMARLRAEAGGVEAQVGFLAVAVHAVGFPLVAEQTGGGGELRHLAGHDFAPERLDVRVDVFAAR